MQLSEGLPSVSGDRVQLQQVILNLIMNGIEAMSEVTGGSRELLISTSEAESGGVLVAVSDTGPGLPPANLARRRSYRIQRAPGSQPPNRVHRWRAGQADARSVRLTVGFAEYPAGSRRRVFLCRASTLPAHGQFTVRPPNNPAAKGVVFLWGDRME
jgi:hypothetical protein